MDPFMADPDDPYSQVSDGSASQVVVVTHNAASPHLRNSQAERGAVGGERGLGGGGGGAAARPVALNRASADLPLQYADEDADGGDPYAVVMKDRNASASNEERGGGGGSDDVDDIEPYSSTSPPAEPPRLYGVSEVGGGGEEGAVGGVGVSTSLASHILQTAVTSSSSSSVRHGV
jgi:hypothetical protein